MTNVTGEPDRGSLNLDRLVVSRVGPPLARTPVAALAACAAVLAVIAGGLAVALDPLIAVGVAAGLGIAVVALVRFDVAVLLLVAAGPVESAVQIASFPQLTLTKVAGGLCFVSFLIHALATRRRLVLDWTHGLVLGLLAVILVSTIQAEESGSALTTATRYASFAALYVVISQLAGDPTLQTRLVWVLSIASAVAAWLAIQNFFAGDAFRATLPYGDPNDTAYALATTLPLTVWLLGQRWRLRPLVFVLIGVIAAGIALSFSRGALVGLAAALVFQLLIQRRHAPALLVAALVAVAGVFVFVQLNPDRIEQGFELKGNANAENADTRLEAWAGALKLTDEHPLLGVGPGNFAASFYEATGRPLGTPGLSAVHNAYLETVAELGLIALVLFVVFIAASFMRSSASNRLGLGPPGLASAVRAALVVATVSAIFLSEQYFPPIWLLGGLATAIWAERRLTSSSAL